MSKHFATLIATLSLTALGAWRPQPLPSQQEQAPPAEPPRDSRLFGRTAGRDAELIEKLQGMWQLLHIEDPNLPPEGRSHHGFLMVSGQFLAIEVHVAWDDEDGYPLEDAFQSGMHEFEIDRVGRLRTVSLIGSFLDEEEELDWEVPGTPRDFSVSLTGNFLTLARSDGSTLDFARRLPRTGHAKDFFGRQIEAPAGSTDVYGRGRSPKKEDGDR